LPSCPCPSSKYTKNYSSYPPLLGELGAGVELKVKRGADCGYLEEKAAVLMVATERILLHGHECASDV